MNMSAAGGATGSLSILAEGKAGPKPLGDGFLPVPEFLKLQSFNLLDDDI